MEKMPKDPIMLMSFINLKLRDFYPSLEALCDDMEINRKELEDTLKAVGYEYSAENNRFW